MLAVFAGYGIAGGMDYADELASEHRPEKTRPHWRDCVAEAALRGVADTALADGQSPVGGRCMVFLRSS
jgi:hypothetical protein